MLNLIQPHAPNAARNIGRLKRDLGVHAFLSSRVAKHLHASAHLYDASTRAAVAQPQNHAAMCRQRRNQAA